MPGAERIETLEIAARDGYRLGATLYHPASPSGLALQIHAAAGVRQEYYAAFAGYLAERGFCVLTFDYRGVGRSAPGAGVKTLRAGMRDWAELDAAGALDFLQNHRSQRKLFAIGHSFGGQSIAVMPGNERLSAVLAVASQSCYWKHWRGAWRAGMWLLTHALVPASTHLFGYFPGALLRQGEDLPAGVALEWARWCRHPGYLVGALGETERAGRLRAPLRLYWVSDDFYAPRAAAEALLNFYPGATHELKAVLPESLGVERVGHFGFFKERFRDSLWREAADWLEENG
jgi:predicted alpha/beta hydrolase